MIPTFSYYRNTLINQNKKWLHGKKIPIVKVKRTQFDPERILFT